MTAGDRFIIQGLAAVAALTTISAALWKLGNRLAQGGN